MNGHVEMAAAFDAGGFDAHDVHMSDLAGGRASLAGFTGLAACGGFSFGDVLGAGGGWANSIVFNPRCRDEFETFFRRGDTFTLGVCNGCQMLARLRDLIPGADAWPRFVRNRSGQFEARLLMTRITGSPSIFLEGMEGWELPTVVAHGEGRAVFDGDARERATRDGLVCLRYVASDGGVARHYPANPNGSEGRRGRRHHPRRARDDHDAAPGTHHPGRAALMASPVLGRARPVAAHVQERREAGRLGSGAKPPPAPGGRKAMQSEIAMAA